LIQFTLKTSVAGPFSRQKKTALGPSSIVLELWKKTSATMFLGKHHNILILMDFFVRIRKAIGEKELSA
jgi:hypothetical protein